jgi:CelD/BcsL family acetyltransferase involved in cellulose biosynthesis
MEWSVVEVSDRSAFVRLGPEWEELARAVDAPPFFGHSFTRIWLDNFAPMARWRVLTARDGEGRLRAALPLVEVRQPFLGVPLLQLSAAANSHSCRFDLLTDDRTLAARAFLPTLRGLADWKVLRLLDVPDEGSSWSLFTSAKEAGLPVGTWESQRSPYVLLPPAWAQMEERLHAKFRANLRRRRKKLEEKGPLTLERVTGGEELDAKLEEGFALEQSGWKGARGTAMSQDGATKEFYQELARSAAQRGELTLYFLRAAGRAVAFHYGLTVGKRYYLLKPGYDEAQKDCSPGQLLMEDVVKDCIDRGLTEVDFLGPDMTWKRDWSNQVRVHNWLFMFPDTLFGRLLHRAKFDWAPLAKRRLTQWSA